MNLKTLDSVQREKMERLVTGQVHLARLATTDPATLQPHVVPVWFHWDGESVWVSSYCSTRKIRELEKNPRCAVVVDTEVDGAISGVLFEGSAELIREPLELVYSQSTEIYTRYLGAEGVLAAEPQEWIHSPENLVIRLAPERIVVW
ncbi:MAG TPA: pyridoxamine 5'-phosphate oxidase family protein [Anaerolineaceae bacterium]|nr:pyridoxamine 5'-phosphate oxidase family protein [Anaerolineaceae bacterium]